MGRYRYRISQEELTAYRAAVLSALHDEPLDHKTICSLVKREIPKLVEDDRFWVEKISTACQTLKKDGRIESVRLPGGRGQAWRGWKRSAS